MKPAALPIVAFLGLQTALAHAACDAHKANANPTSRYVLKAGTAFDKKSKLTWQRCSVGQTWQEGKGCIGTVKGLPRLQAELLEEDGWRLPTVDELATLVSPTCTRPSINEEVFPGMDVGSLYYWSKTVPREAYLNYVNFETGAVSADSDGEHYAVRLVRSGP